MKKVVDEYTQTSVVYPNDFEVVSEDIPCLGGIIEGKGTIIYKCTDHPDWSVFVLKAEWVDDKLHGPFSIHHDGRVLVSGEYRNNVIQFKGRACSSIRLTSDGVFPIPIQTETNSSYYTSLLRLKQQIPSAGMVEEGDDGYQEGSLDNHENKANDHEKNAGYHESTTSLPDDDSTYYEDDVIVAATPRALDGENSIEKRMKELIKTMIFNNRNRTLAASYKNDNAYSSFWLLTSLDGDKPYLLSVRVTGGLPNGNTFIYQRSPLRFLGTMIMSQGVCQQFIPPKLGSDFAEGMIDLSKNGDRWEGEIRNMKPNGKGQFFNEENRLVYEGTIISGRANGVGTSFYDNGVRAYYGMWSQGRKHGWGTEYDRKGKKMREGVWVEDSWVKMQRNPETIEDQLKLEDYNLLVNVMYLSASYKSTMDLKISNYPALQALFINGKCFGNTNLHLTNLPSLRKLIVSNDFGSRQFSYYYDCLLVSSCPLLSEVWIGVDMTTGVIFKEKARSKPSGKWDPVGKRKFEKRFVMEELEKVMGWKSSGVPVLDLKEPQIGMAAFIHVDRTSAWMTGFDSDERRNGCVCSL